MGEALPPGFRFHPTDEELITYYLARKVSDFGFTSKAVAVVDLNKCEPWDLPEKASMGEKEWYFFSLKDRKYPTGLRTNRATESGYWKTTGKDKEIFRAGVLVGMKKTLVFYKGRAPTGQKSNWVMHEYRLENKHPFKHTKEEWVICRIFQKSNAVKKPHQAPSSYEPSIDSPCDTNSIANEFGDIIELPNIINSISNPSISTGFVNNNIISTQGFMTNDNNMMSTLTNMNWTNVNSLPPLSLWPSNLLSSNLSMNSFVLKALQLRNTASTFQPSTDHSCSYMPQGGVSHLGTDRDINTTADFQLDSSSSSSSKMMNNSYKVVDCVSQQQQQQPEQPFNLDSVW